jgi:glycosyltransferase involved in cell wall biosynthesis
MKIGFISRAFPLDAETSVFGVYKRMSMFIDAIKDMGELDMLFYVDPDVPTSAGFRWEMENRLSRLWDAKLRLNLCKLASIKEPKGRWGEYINPALRIVDQPPYQQAARKRQVDAFHRLLFRRPDILFVHRLACMPPVVFSGRELPPVYFDLDDVEHVAFERSIRQPPRWFGKPLLYLRLPILFAFERRSVRLSRKTFVCSEGDRRYLAKACGRNNVAVIPNAIDIPSKESLCAFPSLLFLGRLSYKPNALAADYLLKSIWPRIRATVPEAKLLIAGSNPDRIDSYSSGSPGVEFLGFVEDLDKLYNEVRVVCCPIMSGGGTRIKILEAAAHGKPVVSTTLGAEGIDLRDKAEILLQDESEAFAQACIRLLKDNELAARIGGAARVAVARLYDKKRVIDRIRMHLHSTDGRVKRLLPAG